MNTLSPVVLAQTCARHRVPFVTFSSDQVFDGALTEPYTEARGVAPVNVYGRSKADMELGVITAHPAALILLDLLIDGERGIWHLANDAAIAWSELGRWAAEMAKISTAGLEACGSHALGLRAARPPYSALGSERGVVLPKLDDALARYLEDRDR